MTGLKRFVALLGLCSLIVGGSIEPAVGALRDGRVHHETTGAALQHEDTRGEHGHEDPSAAGEHSHDESHEHGTGADHCTHAHSPALPTVGLLVASVVVTAVPSYPVGRLVLRPFTADPPPPRA